MQARLASGKMGKGIIEILETIPNITGWQVLITGATDGIGRALSEMLAFKGASLTILARSEKKAQALIAQLKRQYLGVEHRYLHCDLSCIVSCEQAALALLRQGVEYDRVFANAGVVGDNRDINSQGLNNTFFTNHIGHFVLLSALLLQKQTLQKQRVIIQSSVAHYLARPRAGFSCYFTRQNTMIPTTSYADSKLANLLCMQAFQKKAGENSKNIKYLAAHPGYLVTNINHAILNMQPCERIKALACGNMKPVLMVLAKRYGVVQASAYTAALPILQAAFTNNPPFYTGPQSFFGMTGMPGPAGMSSAAKNIKLMQLLYTKTLEYCRKATSHAALWR